MMLGENHMLFSMYFKIDILFYYGFYMKQLSVKNEKVFVKTYLHSFYQVILISCSYSLTQL